MAKTNRSTTALMAVLIFMVSLLTLALLVTALLVLSRKSATGGEETTDPSQATTSDPSGSNLLGSRSLEYQISDDGTSYTVIAMGKDPAFNVLIPPTYRGLPVTRIEESAFSNCDILRRVSIPASVTSIGRYAFVGCYNLSEVHITDMGAWCSIEFEDETANPLRNSASGLYLLGEEVTEVVIPRGVQRIGAYAFFSYARLKSVVLADTITDVGRYAFYDCYNLQLSAHEKGQYLGSRSNPYLCLVNVPDKKIVSFEIPETTRVIYSAFQNCSELKQIKIPESVVTIGDYAFHGCVRLSRIEFSTGLRRIGSYAVGSKYILKLNLPEGVVEIDDWAFYNCEYLEKVSIPNSIQSIGRNVFASTPGSMQYNWYRGESFLGNAENPYLYLYNAYQKKELILPSGTALITSTVFKRGTPFETITVEAGNTVYHADGNCLIRTADKTLLLGCNDSVIPTDGSVTSIADFAFRSCKTLEKVTIPNGVTSIGASAFANCEQLAELELPESMIAIGASAFSNCIALTELTIRDNVKAIGNEAFSGCRELQNAMIPDSVMEIGHGAFQNCEMLETVILGDGIRSLRYDTFYCCYNLANVTLSDQLREIGESAFGLCGSLTSIKIPKSVIDIAPDAFRESGLTSLEVEDGNSVYRSAGNCLIVKATKTLLIGTNGSVIPDDGSVTRIAANAFSHCYELAEISIPSTVKRIGTEAFYNCSELKSITIPDGVELLGNSAFEYCERLESATIAGSVQHIGARVFANCIQLTRITLGEGIKSIETAAFNCCYRLKDVSLPGTLESIGTEAFSQCSDLTELSLPIALERIENGAFSGCRELVSFVIPHSVTFIGASAFSGCLNLTSVTFESTSGWYYLDASMAEVVIPVIDPAVNADNLVVEFLYQDWMCK